MGLKYLKEVDDLLEQYPDVMGVAEVAIIKEIALKSHGPESDQHAGGKPRVSNQETLWPGEVYITRVQFGAHVGLGPTALSDKVSELARDGLLLRLRDGKRGTATVYKYPGRDALATFMATRPKRRRKRPTE